MHIKTLPLGGLQTNCYIVTDPETKRCAVIDPGDEAAVILQYLEEHALTPSTVFLTHGHYDHTMAADDVALKYDVPVYISEQDICTDFRPTPYLYSPSVKPSPWVDGDEIQVGGLTFQVIATPGHSPGSVCILAGDCLFTGDTLFRDDCGRSDLPGSNSKHLLESLARLHALEGDLEVYPGHMEASSLDRERRFNHYLRQAARK